MEPKKRTRGLQYLKLKEFSDFNEAKQELKILKIKGYKLLYDRETVLKDYSKHIYICRRGCPVRAHLNLHPDTTMCTLFVSDNEHSHEITNTRKLPAESKQKVVELTKLGVTPKEIVRQIAEAENIKQLRFDQIYGIRRRENQETLGTATTDLMQFVQWCTDNTTILADEDQPFVLKFE